MCLWVPLHIFGGSEIAIIPPYARETGAPLLPGAPSAGANGEGPTFALKPADDFYRRLSLSQSP
jgi:hypothetical protein